MRSRYAAPFKLLLFCWGLLQIVGPFVIIAQPRISIDVLQNQQISLEQRLKVLEEQSLDRRMAVQETLIEGILRLQQITSVGTGLALTGGLTYMRKRRNESLLVKGD